MPAKFIINKDKKGKYRFHLLATNGQTIATGESYPDKASALNGIDWIQRNAPNSKILDFTVGKAPVNACARFEVYKDKKGEYPFHLKDANGKTIATAGESYPTKTAAFKGIAGIQKNAPIAAIVDETGDDDKDDKHPRPRPKHENNEGPTILVTEAKDLTMPLSDRRIIIVVADNGSVKMTGMTHVTMSAAKELFKFSPNHPIANTAYAMAEIYPDVYRPVVEFHDYFKQRKSQAFNKLCASLGAKEVYIESAEINNQNLDLKSDVKTPLTSLGLGFTLKQNRETVEISAFRFSLHVLRVLFLLSSLPLQSDPPPLKIFPQLLRYFPRSKRGIGILQRQLVIF